jgi:hypothetical protein
VSRRLEIRRKATVTATKTRKRSAAAAGRRRSGGGGLGFGFGASGRRIFGGDPAVAGRGRRGGGGPEGSGRRSVPASGSAYQEMAGSRGGWVLHCCS